MTCQELLALSGALSAALPTGQLALDSLFTSLSQTILSSQSRREGVPSSPTICFADQPHLKVNPTISYMSRQSDSQDVYHMDTGYTQLHCFMIFTFL